MSAALVVEAPGPFTTLQDLGRTGHQAAGIPVSGALDPESLRLANTLVGNTEGEAALEMRLAGPTLKIAADHVRVALCGASSPLEIIAPERGEIAPWRTVRLERGAVIRVPPLRESVTAYLAVEGDSTRRRFSAAARHACELGLADSKGASSRRATGSD